MKKRIVVHIHGGHADTKDAKDGERFVHLVRDGSFYCKVYYDSDLEEYCCKLYHGGIYYSSADYFSDDKADAISTAKSMVQRLKAQFMKDEAPATLDSVVLRASDAGWTTYDPREVARIDARIKELEKELQSLKQERSKYRDGA